MCLLSPVPRGPVLENTAGKCGPLNLIFSPHHPTRPPPYVSLHKQTPCTLLLLWESQGFVLMFVLIVVKVT